MKNETPITTPTPTQTQAPIPMHGDNFDFIGMVNNPTKELTLPLTDLECSFISHLFLYDALAHGETVEYNGEILRKTPQGENVINAILKTLLAIASADEQMIMKMDDYIRYETIIKENKTTLTSIVHGDEELLDESIIRDTAQCHTQSEVKD